MNTHNIVANLYGIFLEVSSEFVLQMLQRILQSINGTVEFSGEAVYNALVEKVGRGSRHRYRHAIRDDQEILKIQREILKPVNDNIDLRKLDFNMYRLIIKLLTGITDQRFLNHFNDLRIALCHYSVSSVVRNRVNQKDFERELHLTKQMLEACEVETDKTLLWRIINPQDNNDDEIISTSGIVE